MKENVKKVYSKTAWSLEPQALQGTAIAEKKKEEN